MSTKKGSLNEDKLHCFWYQYTQLVYIYSFRIFSLLSLTQSLYRLAAPLRKPLLQNKGKSAWRKNHFTAK